MLEPAPPSAPRPPDQPLGHQRLLDRVRARQRRLLSLLGAVAGASAAFALFTLGALAALRFPRLGHALVVWSLPLGAAAGTALAVWLIRRRVGSDERTARHLARLVPELKLDLLAAVELSKALGERHDFSPELARAFLAEVDAQVQRTEVNRLRERRELRWASRGGLALVLLCGLTLFFSRERVSAGLGVAFAPKLAPALKREPITGDVTVRYRYPAYTGLEPKVVEGGTGDISAPAGTEVSLDTRADREVKSAALELNGKRLPLVRDGRQLKGSFVLDKPGQYHVLFLDGEEVVAEGPDRSVRIEADLAPEVQLTAPMPELEVEADQQKVMLKFEAHDDYGLSSLELVFARPGKPEERVKLAHDEGRATRSQYQWDVGALKLTPGQIVSYYLEAKDNDAVAGPKRGVSRTQTVKLYSAAEHREEALEKAQKVWERLVSHLADRMEGHDRGRDSTLEQVNAGAAIDEQGQTLAGDALTLSGELAQDKDAPEELSDALANIAGSLRHVVSQTMMARRLAGRLHGERPDFSVALTRRAGEEIRSTEQDVLYLESLLDRQRLEAIKQLTQELKSDRRELSRLMEDYAQAPDAAKQQALLEQMELLKEHMQQLLQKMSELQKEIRDEHLNREALQELESQNIPDDFNELEKLIKEGKTEEALKKMQELSMEVDSLLNQVEEAADDAEQEADPELTKAFEEFEKNLDQAVQKQSELADDSQKVRERYKEQVRQRVQQRGEQLKQELLKKTQELKQSYEQLDASRFGSQMDVSKAAAQQQLEHLEQALQANDFDLALEAADQLTQEAERAAGQAEEQRLQDERFGNPPSAMRESQQLEQRLKRDARKAEEIDQKLRGLFPSPQQMLSEEDQQKLKDQAQRQKGLEKQAEQLQQQMDELSQKAPIFGPEQRQQLDQAQQRMGEARQSLDGRDVRKAHGSQQAALEQLQGLQKQMQQSGGGGKGKKGLPRPLSNGRGRDGRGSLRQDKVEIPDEDPNAPTKEIRKDLMDAMKQGAPDRYKEQNKRYYEELVK